jgi:UDP-N-acetyl-alpha-D-muramoyl-L-alanyl-L-glutamate epimerase
MSAGRIRCALLHEPMTPSSPRYSTFRYVGYDIDAGQGTVRARYALDDWAFEEQITVPGDYDWSAPAVDEAARLFFLLAGVSYYKAAAPAVIDLGTTPMRPGDTEFLRSFYLDGLGEFAYRNGLDLSSLQIVGGAPAPRPAPYAAVEGRPLIPFGGGIDSIVTVEAVRYAFPDAALFVLSRGGDRFEAIEAAVSVVDLPVLRAERSLDPEILRSREHGFLNGHVPVTGILSAVGVLVAVLAGRDEVVMSNEWSASIGNLEVEGRSVNHQYSKSLEFETAFRALLHRSFDRAPGYFSLLRPYSELWVAERFARLDRYHGAFRSCNRAFHINPAQRLDHWCGTCDKCCFIDLVLAPFLPAERLAAIFAGAEPLENPALAEQFRTLVGISSDTKPFECVGEVGECQTAVVMAARRADRADTPILQALADRLTDTVPADVDRLLRPLGESYIPNAYAPQDLLV